MQRFPEIDLMRGIAIIMMIIFHFLFDLNFFGFADISLYSGLWLVFQRITITLFLLLVGVSLHISYERLENKSLSSVFAKFGKRSAFLFAVSALITLGTYIFLNGSGYVIFGVIHLIALSTLLSILFVGQNKFVNLIAGLAIIGVGFLTYGMTSVSIIGLIVGFPPANFSTVDYVPLFPYFGIVLIGIFIGKTFYAKGQRIFNLPETNLNATPFAQLAFLGKNSLIIYLVHQIVLVGLILLSLFVKVSIS